MDSWSAGSFNRSIQDAFGASRADEAGGFRRARKLPEERRPDAFPSSRGAGQKHGAHQPGAHLPAHPFVKFLALPFGGIRLPLAVPVSSGYFAKGTGKTAVPILGASQNQQVETPLSPAT